ncbi:MAG: hypothetical protein WBH85_10970 [Thermoanaerobaculia bacterium]
MKGDSTTTGQVRIWVGFLEGIQKLPRILDKERPRDELLLVFGLERGSCDQGEQHK